MPGYLRSVVGIAALAVAWLATSGTTSATQVDEAIAQAQRTGSPLLVVVSSPT